MITRYICLLLVSALIFCFSSCVINEEETTTEESTTEEVTTEEATTEVETTEEIKETVNIEFSEKRAKEIYSFNSEIYGTLKIFLQDGYFLIFDEFGTKRFTVFAENYSEEKTDGTPIGINADMNFDGYTDFGLCYYKDTLNSYYFCFLWDNEARTFRYFLPLSNLANPEFEPLAEIVISKNRQTFEKAIKEKYYFLSDELRLLSSENITEETTENTVIGAESIDANLSVLENGNSAYITLDANPYSLSQWKCTVDKEGIVELSSENYNETDNKYEFLLSAVSEGDCTVTFRYVSPETDTYAEEININVFVDENSVVSVVVPG